VEKRKSQKALWAFPLVYIVIIKDSFRQGKFNAFAPGAA
jgi:hypothetical protein